MYNWHRPTSVQRPKFQNSSALHLRSHLELLSPSCFHISMHPDADLIPSVSLSLLRSRHKYHSQVLAGSTPSVIIIVVVYDRVFPEHPSGAAEMSAVQIHISFDHAQRRTGGDGYKGNLRGPGLPMPMEAIEVLREVTGRSTAKTT